MGLIPSLVLSLSQLTQSRLKLRNYELLCNCLITTPTKLQQPITRLLCLKHKYTLAPPQSNADDCSRMRHSTGTPWPSSSTCASSSARKLYLVLEGTISGHLEQWFFAVLD